MAETTDKIMERLTNNMPDRYDTRPGTYTYDIEKTVAIEFENAYDRIDNLERQSRVSTATGKYLDELVARVGLKRKQSTAATGYVVIHGDVGATVVAGSKVAAGNIIFNITDSASIGTEGSVIVPVVCDTSGLNGNVKAGHINRFPITLPGLLSVSNEYDITGGSDEETDTELRARYFEYIEHPITSGNKWQYIAWARSVDGVGDAKCQPLWNGNGTVKVIIVDAQKQLAPVELINKVQKYIEDQQPFGATLTVVTATELTIDISCKIIFESDVAETVKKNIENYFRNVSFTSGYVSYAKIGQIIMDTNGVIDYSDLKINNSTSNIPIGETEIAALGVVNFG